MSVVYNQSEKIKINSLNGGKKKKRKGRESNSYAIEQHD